MDILSHARRRAFSLWLRTGRLPSWARARSTETKYNPWHDPDDGRFTHAGTGRYFGRGGGGRASRSVDARMSNRPKEPYGGFAGGGDSFPGSGASGSYELDPPSQQPRGEQTTGTSPAPPQGGTQTAPRRSRRAIDNPDNWRRVEANGYSYWIDTAGRTRRVTGRIVENRAQGRSPSNQKEAGHPDRRRDDHGGHFIARRFNGPTEKFNHFAQNSHFNQSGYTALENQWSRAVRAGRTVEVKIEPVYEGSSQRPSRINVWFWIDGRRQSLQFPNERAEGSNARR